jgi:hypothetical protein
MIVAAIVFGCAPAPERSASGPPIPTWIKVGQPWAQATATARSAGYELHDSVALNLPQTSSDSHGFYIELGSGHGTLVVLRRTPDGPVARMTWLVRWSSPGMLPEWHEVLGCEVNPADTGAR